MGMRLLAAIVPVLALSSVPAAAATRRLTIEQPLTPAPAAVRTSAGDGVVAWTAADTAAFDSPATLWVLEAGTVRQVARLPAAPDTLDVGRDADEVPLAAITVFVPGGQGTKTTTLVRLTDGTTRPGPAPPAGYRVSGAAIDHGQLRYTDVRTGPFSSTRSSLWTATVIAAQTGPAHEIRASRRGDGWFGILADWGRVAVAVARSGQVGESHVGIGFGTPRRPWHRVDDLFGDAGDYNVQRAAGFTRDHAALITVQNRPGGGPLVRRLSLATGRVTARARLGKGVRQDASVALTPDGRLLALGHDATGARVVGLTSVAFR